MYVEQFVKCFLELNFAFPVVHNRQDAWLKVGKRGGEITLSKHVKIGNKNIRIPAPGKNRMRSIQDLAR